MIYEVRENPVTGDQELVSLAGVESSTIGCKWCSNELYACITDCADCSLGMINSSATQLGYNASASNCSTAIGVGSVSCCNGIAINGEACDTDAIAIGTTAAADTVAIGDKVVVDTSAVIVGKSATGLSCSVSIGANATTAACSTAIGYCACATNGSVAIGSNATATCGIDIKGVCSEVYIEGPVGTTSIGYSNVIRSDGNTVVGSYLDIGNSVGDSVIIGQSNSIPDNCALDGVTIIGDLGEIGVDYQETVGGGDVVIGLYNCNPFHYCSSNGYTYSGSCLMTGRILPSSSCLPATDCSNILFFVS